MLNFIRTGSSNLINNSHISFAKDYQGFIFTVNIYLSIVLGSSSNNKNNNNNNYSNNNNDDNMNNNNNGNGNGKGKGNENSKDGEDENINKDDFYIYGALVKFISDNN